MPHPWPAYAAAPIWQALFWSSYLAWIGMELWVFSRDRRAASGDRGDRGSLRFLVVVFAIGLWGVFAAGHRLTWGRIGLPAQVLIPLRKRTALQYLFQPLTDSIWRSFHEK